MAPSRTATLHLPVRRCRFLCSGLLASAIYVWASQGVSAQSSADIFAAIEDSISDVVEKAEGSIVAIARIPIAVESLDRQWVY